MPARCLRLVPAVALAMLLAAPAAADVVTTTDGLVLEGSVTKAEDGSLVVATDDGSVRLAASSVASVVPGEGPRAKARREAAAIPAVDADGHFRLAVRLESQGLSDLARAEYEAVLAADADHAAARRALGYERAGGEWVTTATARKRSGLVLYDGRWLLPAEVEALGRRQGPASAKDASVVGAMRVAATGEPALARAAAVRLLAVSAEERLMSSTALLLDRDPKVRAYAATNLGALGDARALKALIVSAVRDPAESVRLASVAAAAAIGHDDIAIPFVRGLDSDHRGVVANSARALASLRDPRGITFLVKKITTHGGSPRVYFEHVDQQSYISDYDVEVAQTSSIADPVIGVLQQGEVLDVQVLDASIETTIVEQVLVDSFNALAGAHAKNAADVAAWWKEHGAGVPRFATSPPPAKSPR